MLRVVLVVIFKALYLCNLTLGYQPVVKQLTTQDIAEFKKNVSDGSQEIRTYLDGDRKYELQWEYDNDTITFDVTVQAKGWVGLGFTTTNGMTNADIVFVWIDKKGEGQISDRHATQNGYPEKDLRQDYTLISATKEDSVFRAKFRRRRDTCDNDQDYKLTTDNTRIIWAYSDTEPSDEDHFEKHLSNTRGIKGVFLFDPPDVQLQVPPDTVTFDLLSDSAKLPTDYHLMYWCQIFEMPKWPVHHLIRIEAVVEATHEPYVHHVGLYQCSKNMSDHMYKGDKCFAGDGFNYSKMYDCASKLLWFWNPGMKASDFPNNVGLPFFESSGDAYVMLEVHYENLELKPGLTDRSGLRMYLAPTLRPIDAAVMFLGTVEQAPNQLLPPGQSEFHFYGHYENCLKLLPDTGINMIYSLLHSHLHGRKMKVHHYRKGLQLPDYAVDENYDFYAQNFRYLDPPRLILPGDEVVLECVYNTTSANGTIFGGFSTTDEMCDSTNFYYPRIAKGFTCFSFPDPRGYVPLFGGELVGNDTVILPSGENVTLSEFVKHHLDWNKPGLIEQYKEFVSNGQYVQELYYQPLSKNSTTDEPVEYLEFTHNGYPKVDQPWTEEKGNDQCGSPDHNAEGAKQQEENKKPGTPMFLTEKALAIKQNLHWTLGVIMIVVVLMSVRDDVGYV